MTWDDHISAEVAAEFSALEGAGIEIDGFEGDLRSMLVGDPAAAWLAQRERRAAKIRRLCRGCGREKPRGPGRHYCHDCAEKAARLDRREQRAASVRKLCRGCGGQKPKGVGRLYCVDCAEARKPRPWSCRGCGGPDRPEGQGGLQFCAPCAAKRHRPPVVWKCADCGSKDRPDASGGTRYCAGCRDKRKPSPWTCCNCGSGERPGKHGRWLYCEECGQGSGLGCPEPSPASIEYRPPADAVCGVKVRGEWWVAMPERIRVLDERTWWVPVDRLPTATQCFVRWNRTGQRFIDRGGAPSEVCRELRKGLIALEAKLAPQGVRGVA